MKCAILCLLISFIIVEAGDCGGNCLNGSCLSCLCGKVKNMVNVQEICKRYSWNQDCCVCIANALSGGNANAIKYYEDGSYEVGVFQINQIHWRSCGGRRAPCDPEANVACAIGIYKGAANRWRPWSSPAAKCGCHK